MQFVRKKRRSPAINIINLIDVLVVLLIFYIVTTVFKKTENNIIIKVPKTTDAGPTTNAPPSIIYVTADSKMFLDQASIQPEQLADLLKQKIAADPNFKVAMKADTKAPFGEITKVLAAAHAAGITDLPTFANPDKGGGP